MTAPDQRAKNVRSQPPRSVPPGTDQEKSADAGQPPAKDSHAVALSYRPDDPDAAPRIVAPAGNAVIMEEQLMKMNETAMDQRLATDIYRKYVGMMRIALGVGGR